VFSFCLRRWPTASNRQWLLLLLRQSSMEAKVLTEAKAKANTTPNGQATFFLTSHQNRGREWGLSTGDCGLGVADGGTYLIGPSMDRPSMAVQWLWMLAVSPLFSVFCFCVFCPGTQKNVVLKLFSIVFDLLKRYF